MERSSTDMKQEAQAKIRAEQHMEASEAANLLNEIAAKSKERCALSEVVFEPTGTALKILEDARSEMEQKQAVIETRIKHHQQSIALLASRIDDLNGSICLLQMEEDAKVMDADRKGDK